MRVAEDSPIVGIIISVYYLACAIGAVIASFWADKRGRKPSIFACLETTALGNFLMFVSGLNVKGGDSSSWNGGALV
jgi:MFS family permease